MLMKEIFQKNLSRYRNKLKVLLYHYLKLKVLNVKQKIQDCKRSFKILGFKPKQDLYGSTY